MTPDREAALALLREAGFTEERGWSVDTLETDINGTSLAQVKYIVPGSVALKIRALSESGEKAAACALISVLKNTLGTGGRIRFVHGDEPHTLQLAEREAQVARLREALEERGEHAQTCARGAWQGGRPRAGGGYESNYGGTWYESVPVDRTPECTCEMAALSRSPSDDAALRVICTKVALRVLAGERGDEREPAYDDDMAPRYVAEVLGESAPPANAAQEGAEG